MGDVLLTFFRWQTLTDSPCLFLFLLLCLFRTYSRLQRLVHSRLAGVSSWPARSASHFDNNFDFNSMIVKALLE